MVITGNTHVAPIGTTWGSVRSPGNLPGPSRALSVPADFLPGEALVGIHVTGKSEDPFGDLVAKHL